MPVGNEYSSVAAKFPHSGEETTASSNSIGSTRNWNYNNYSSLHLKETIVVTQELLMRLKVNSYAVMQVCYLYTMVFTSLFIQRDLGQWDLGQWDLGQLVHLTANADDLAMTTILSQTKDVVYQVFTVLSMLARQTFGITLHISESYIQSIFLFCHSCLLRRMDIPDDELAVANGPQSCNPVTVILG